MGLITWGKLVQVTLLLQNLLSRFFGQVIIVQSQPSLTATVFQSKRFYHFLEIRWLLAYQIVQRL